MDKLTITLECTPWQAAQLSEALRLHKAHCVAEWTNRKERGSVIAMSAAEIQEMLAAVNEQIMKATSPEISPNAISHAAAHID